MSRGSGLGGRSRLHITLPDELLAAVEIRRKLEGRDRSEFIEEAVHKCIEERDREGLERRNGLGARLRDLEDAVLGVRELVGELGLRNLYASERTYAIFEAQFGDRIVASRRDTHEVARRRLSPGGADDDAVPQRGGQNRKGSI